MPQPILRTERLLLIPLASRHVELEVALDSDPEVLRYIFGRARRRDEVLASHAQRMASASSVDGLGYWTAFGSDEGAADDPTVSELGYRLHRQYWRRGLAREAARALLRHAFETVGQSRVIAQTMAVNTGS